MTFKNKTINAYLHFTFQSGYIQILLLRKTVCRLVTFTFQSGYIQIISVDGLPVMSIVFTFQSGYIQIQPQLHMFYQQNTLHSNLVIFKWVSPTSFVLP